MAQQIVKSRVNLLGSCKGIVLGKRSLKIVYKSGTQRVNYSEMLGFCTIERSFRGDEDKSCKFMGPLSPRLQQRLKEKDRVPLN